MHALYIHFVRGARHSKPPYKKKFPAGPNQQACKHYPHGLHISDISYTCRYRM